MKIFVIVALCAVAVYAEENEVLKRYERDCMTENGIDPTVQDPKNLTLEDGNCYYACYFKKFGIMKKDGSYDVAAIKEKYSKPNSVEAVQKKLDEITQTYCQDKAGNQCNLAACLSKISKEQWQI
ncbi:hypothetical protein TSAR_003825 [Trichomalopsis sarcophagae]|uniref:Uncharacterized protein n=1 Tax=Trichomalopsis sarcophagae TaxID=543379 RepID=A0A232FG27_9HYME|nr:hypothetical protein TSAR_003825 [Trichomalopsis sarcophagae]